jgi:hypothetical protein
MEEASGKKIFILYPHSVIKDELLDILIMAGFEAYVLHDHNRAAKLLAKFPDSIMFINIDEGMEEPKWEAYIRGIMESPMTKNCRLGILSYNTDQKLMEKYLMQLSVPCGYIQLKLGIKESTQIMLAALEANEARGRRKFIRIACEDELMATVNYKGSKEVYQGKLLDISATGIATRFNTMENLPEKAVIRGMQLNLRGSLALIDAVLMLKRQNNVYVFLFDTAKMPLEHKLTIFHFIKYKLQQYIDNLAV